MKDPQPPPPGGNWRIVVLGGSSPFVAGLVDALVPIQGGLQRPEFVLVGRDSKTLEAVRLHAESRLPSWRVLSDTDRSRALEGADLVLHQIRYGGLDGRSADEALAARFGVCPDETLGPGGLQRVLHSAAGLRETAALLRKCCPDALTLNLTNPLSCATAVMHEAGAANLVGLCELPSVTHAALCRARAVDPELTTWQYSGLNHRGFIHSVRGDGRDLIAEFADSSDEPIGGIAPRVVAELGALPTKYFALGEGEIRLGRGGVLAGIRERIRAELLSDPTRIPPSLSAREQPWYSAAVGPVLGALRGGTPLRTSLNVVDGVLVRERLATVSSDGIRVEEHADPPTAAISWIQRFEEHELAILVALRDPSVASISEALACDPLLPVSEPRSVAMAILNALPS